MKVSVIMPLYNSAKFIHTSAQSILSQTYREFELILVDDHSEDNTFSLAQEIVSTTPNVFLLKNKCAKGISGAINTGIDVASGDLIANMDHDDISLPERLEKQVAIFMKRRNIGICGTWMQEFEEGDSIWRYPTDNNEIKVRAILFAPIANPTSMIRKSVLDKNNLRYRSEYDTAQDYDMWIRLLALTDFAVVPEVLVRYRIHKTNASRQFETKQNQAWHELLTSLLENMGVKPTQSMINALFNMRFSSYPNTDEDRGNLLKYSQEILEANQTSRFLPQSSLGQLFTDKLRGPT